MSKKEITKKDDDVIEVHPTIEEAKAMFKNRPDLSAVVTDKGVLYRDGMLA
jgi:predicted nuclease with RNAse H fold